MRLTLWIEETIDLPDGEIPSLRVRVRERLGVPPDDPVYPYDLIAQVFLDGLLPPPPGAWDCPEEAALPSVEEDDPRAG